VPASACRGWRIARLQGRCRSGRRLRRIELRQDRLQRRQPRRERVGVIIDRAAKKPGKGGRLVVGKIEHHNSVICCLGLQDGFQPRHLARRQPFDPRARYRRRAGSGSPSRSDARPRRSRGATRLGADTAGHRSTASTGRGKVELRLRHVMRDLWDRLLDFAVAIRLGILDRLMPLQRDARRPRDPRGGRAAEEGVSVARRASEPQRYSDDSPRRPP
jgi:hypothetical protein